MKCTHCEYEHEVCGEQGAFGEFFELDSVKTERYAKGQMDYRELYACPSCGVAFIEVYHA